ncbi:MAG: GNAT family N-acetyltransferase [Proteobacteria bacterium]|nr:GNAT family N-acetyltransferase [Pseudomonadota bacterium]
MIGLVPFAPEHFAILAGWFACERDVVQWGGTLVRYPLTAEQMQAMLDQGQTEPPGRLCWMAIQSAQCVGHAQLGFDWRNGIAILSRVAVAPGHRGLGLAIPMVRQMLAKAFARKEIERVELNVYAWNTSAIRTYARLGFVHEGTRRLAACVGNERWDTVMMGLLRAEWAGDEATTRPRP